MILRHHIQRLMCEATTRLVQAHGRAETELALLRLLSWYLVACDAAVLLLVGMRAWAALGIVVVTRVWIWRMRERWNTRVRAACREVTYETGKAEGLQDVLSVVWIEVVPGGGRRTAKRDWKDVS